MTLDNDERIQHLVECFDDSGMIGGEKWSTTFEPLLWILFENLDRMDPDTFRLDDETLRAELKDYLKSIRNESDPVDAFWNGYDDFRNGLYESELEEYKVYFPLNIVLPDEFDVSTLPLLGIEFEQTEKDEWLNHIPDFPERERHPFNQAIAQCPNDLTASHFTYWKASQEARNHSYAVNRVLGVTEVLMGQMNFARMYGTQQFHKGDVTPWPVRRADLRSPFLATVWLNEEYVFNRFNTDQSHRKKDRISSTRKERFINIFKDLPSFKDEHPTDEFLIAAFQQFQMGVSAAEDEHAFFDLWRGLETLTQTDTTDSNNSMKTVIDRAKSVASWKDEQTTNEQAERVARIRNQVAHESGYTLIGRKDKGFLETLLSTLIRFYIENREYWSKSDFEYALEKMQMSPESLEQSLCIKQREVEILEEIKSI